MIHKFLSWPIRIHLIILLLLLALPCMLLILRSGLEERNDAIADAKRDCLRVVETIAAEQQALIAGAEQLATTLALLPEVQSGNRKAVTALFADLVKKNRQYASISVADKSGLIWASATPFEGTISLADRRYFQEVVRTGMFSSGEYVTGKMIKKPVMIFGYPVKNAADEVTGVIAIVLDLGHVQNIFKKIGLPSEAAFSLLDRHGVILIRNLKDSFSTNLVGMPDKRAELFTRMKEGPDEGTWEAMGNDEKFRLSAYKRISLPHESSPYLYIRSSIPLASVTSGANAAMFKNLAFLILVFGIGFVLVWFIGKRVIMNPIKLLMKASGQLGVGAGAVNVSQAVKGGELGELARTFDDMAEALTEREAALRESQERWATTLASIGDAVIATDTEGRITFMNAAAEGVTGWSLAEATGEPVTGIFNIINEHTRREVENPVAKVLLYGKVIGLANHTILIRKDGAEVPIDDSGAPIRDKDGMIMGVVLVFRDITDRKRAEENLQRSEERYRLVAQTMLQGVVHQDVTGKIIAMNPAAERILGKSPEEFLGRTSVDEEHHTLRKDGTPFPGMEHPAMVSLRTGQPLANVIMGLFNPREKAYRWINVSAVPVFRPGETKASEVYTVFEDITERRQAEEALQQSEERLRFALETIHTGAWDLDLVDHTAFRTLEHDRIFGYPQLLPEWTYEMFLEHVLPEDRATVDRKFQRAIENLEDWNFECRILRTDGEIRWIWAAGRHTRDETGVSRRMAGIVQDITEHKRAEEALRESERLYRAIGESINYGIWMCDPDGKNIYASESFLKMVGLTQEECSSFGWGNVLHPDDAEQTIAAWQACVRSGGTWDREHRFKGVDGQWHHVLARGIPVRDENGRITHWAGINLDIGNIKQMEDELRRARDELELRVQERTAELRKSEEIAQEQKREMETYYLTAPIGLCVLDTDLRYLRINEHLAEMNGIPASEHLGRTLREIVPWLGDEAERVSRQIIETGEPVTAMEMTRETPEPSGVKRTWVGGWYPLKDLQGKVVAISVVAEEVTKQRRLEDQLRQAQKMEAIGTLAGGIAHDFNNVLAAIIGFTEMAADDVPDNPNVQKSLQNVLKSAMRARELVKQILSFSRKTSHERNPLSLTPVIKETVKLLRASIPATIEIRLSATASSDVVLASPVEVQQILMNLATNASLAMQEKGGTVEIGISDIDFEPDSAVFGPDVVTGEYLQIMVKDTGIGMGPEVMKRVFDPFFTTREVGKGTGMGLAVVYGIVKSLQGTITVESESGFGSIFRVFLPKVKTNAKKEMVSPVEIFGGKERVLFIDDEEMLAEWGQATLHKLGYQVTAVTDSKEALGIFSIDPFSFDLVVTDQAMPRMAGDRLAKKLLDIRSDIPIILCTGHSETISLEKAKEIGIREFLPKPLTRQELAGAVRRVLNTKSKA